MRVGKILALGAAATLSVFTLAACGNSQGASGHKGQLNLMLPAEMPTLDPSIATDNESLTALSNTQEGIYRLGKNSKPENALATKTTVSKDGLHWTFNLRHGVKWSNGDTVTAQNFVDSWRRTNNPKTGSQYAYLFEGVKNADAVQKGKAKLSSLGIKADGKYKLSVTLSKPIPYFKLLLGFPVFFPQDQKAIDKYGKKYGQTSATQVYNGPFKVSGYKGTNSKWSWVKNNTYWDKKHVKLDKINFQVVKESNTALNLYNSKKVDMTQLTGDQVAQYKNNKNYIYRPGSSAAYVELNEDKVPAFKNQKIRAALSYAISRTQLTNNVLQDGSKPAKTFTPPKLAKDPSTGEDFASEAEVKGALTQNLTKAKELLKEGEQEAGITDLHFSLMADDTDTGKKNAEFLQTEFEKLPGVKVDVNNVPYKTRLTRSADHNFQSVVTLWGADYNDPYTFALFTSDGTYNDGLWKNATYDQNVADSAGKNALNKEARFKNLVTADQTLVKDYGVLPLYTGSFSGSGPFLQRPYVKGIIYNSAGINWNYKEAYVK
ncbi:peptide ABC transporter substrate-binding protein [Furfurilactobacillus curtus]|uniref:Peptide ABC transporter substrate-binding protein n=1 Tax=Furfurilactobacillus curtus TaxID=1746200 RepID=A0ABQ5JSD8_9LACO